MDRFVARENVKHLRGQLVSQRDPKKRSVLKKVLVEEEDRLGADHELLADVDGHIRRGSELIVRQMVLVATMERDGHPSLTQAKALLDDLIDSQDLHLGYRRRALIRIEENKLQFR